MRIAHVVRGATDAYDRAIDLAKHQRRRGVHAEVVCLERRVPPGFIHRRQWYESRGGVPVEHFMYSRSGLVRSLSKMLASLSSFDLVQIHGEDFAFDVLAAVRPLIGKPFLRSYAGWRVMPQKLSAVSQLRSGLTPGIRAAIASPADEPASVEAVADRQIDVYRRVLGTPARSLMGVDIRAADRERAVSEIDTRMDREGCVRVAFVNAHSLNIAARDAGYKSALGRFLVLNDGLGIDLASQIKYGHTFPDNLNGTDFVPYFLRTTRRRLRIYLIGTSDAAVGEAARKMSLRFPRHEFVGFRNGFFTGPQDIENSCRKIKESEADCVLVGMGNPLQESWIDMHGDKTGARLLMGVGALLDFEAGVVRRAPAWVRRLHCEWGYRLLQEPRRLARRYLVGNIVFIGRAFLDARQ